MTRLKIAMISCSAVLSTVLLLSGCSTKQPDISKAQAECVIQGEEAPNWVCGNDQKIDGNLFYSVGSASTSKLGYSFTLREANADARSNLAQRVETEVKDKIERFARSTGVEKNEVADKVSTQVSKQVAKVTLTDSTQIRSWEHPKSGALFVMIAVDKNNVNHAAKQGLLSSYKNDSALWQQLQSEKALKGLEEEFKDYKSVTQDQASAKI